MKLISSATVFAVAAAVAVTGVSGELRGSGAAAVAATTERKLFVPPGIAPPSSSVTETPLNAAETFAPFSPTPPLSMNAMECTAVATESLNEEYVVVQYNNTMPNGTMISEANMLDFTNRTESFEIDVTYVYAYNIAMGVCPQKGAFRQVYYAEVIAYDLEQSTFLLRLGTDSNAAKDRFQDLPMSNNCGIVIYNDTAGAMDTDWGYSIGGSDDEDGRRRSRRKLQNVATTPEQIESLTTPETETTPVTVTTPSDGESESDGELAACDCSPPTAMDVLTIFNEAISISMDDDSFFNWTVATQQLCVIPDCVPAEGEVASYNETGVCLTGSLPPLSQYPSETPSEVPTGTDLPTIAPTTMTPTSTDVPTAEDDTDSPSEPFTFAPSPYDTDSPSEPSSDGTDSPSEPSSDGTDSPTKIITLAPTIVKTPAPSIVTTPAPSIVTTPAPFENTPAPVETSQAPFNNTGTRFLVWDGENMIVEEVSSTSGATVSKKNNNNSNIAMQAEVGGVGSIISQEPFAYEQEHKICQEVDAKLIDNYENRKLCQTYLDLPYIRTKQVTEDEDEDESSCPMNEQVPKTYFSVSKSNEQSHEQLGITLSNPSYERKHYGDEEAHEFVKENCGDDVGNAYECLAPPAYRADLFRFCALYTHGGLYMDSDMIPLVPLEELYDPCSVATVGHDWPQGKPQKQMKILAGQAGAPIFLCMINKIVTSVRSRYYPENPLALTGPMALHECYDENSMDVSITYHDTRDAAYPYSGMRSVERNKLVAFESPNNHNDKNYKIDFELHEVYRDTCPLHKKKKNVVVAAPVKISNA